MQHPGGSCCDLLRFCLLQAPRPALPDSDPALDAPPVGQGHTRSCRVRLQGSLLRALRWARPQVTPPHVARILSLPSCSVGWNPGQGMVLKALGWFCQILPLWGWVLTTDTCLACLQKPCQGPRVLGAGWPTPWCRCRQLPFPQPSLGGLGTGDGPWMLCFTQLLGVTAPL